MVAFATKIPRISSPATEEKWSLIGVVRCFWRVLENYDCRTKFNSSLGMEHNGGLYGFSAVKVKLVDSLI